MAKKQNDKDSVRSSTSSLKSLVSEAKRSIKTVKRKATALLNPKKKKKVDNLLERDNNTSTDLLSQQSSQTGLTSRASPIDVSDDDEGQDADEDLRK